MPAESGLEDGTRVHRGDRDSQGTEPSLQRHREQHVRRLGLAIGLPFVVGTTHIVDVIEIHIREFVASRSQVDDPCRRTLEQRRYEQAGEQEMPEVAGRELHLVAFSGARERTRHHARIVDQHVELPVHIAVSRRCGAHGIERGEIELKPIDAVIAAETGKLRSHSPHPTGITTGYGYRRTACRKRPRGLAPQARRSTCHQRAHPGEIQPLENLLCSGVTIDHRVGFAAGGASLAGECAAISPCFRMRMLRERGSLRSIRASRR